MPLVPYNLKIVRDVLAIVDKDKDRAGRVLCLSYPDVIATREQVIEIFGPRVRKVPARADAEATIRWHKAWSHTDEILDTKALFASLGYAMDAIDVTEGRGGEFIHDLSEPLPPLWHGHSSYDLVFDCVSNHVFNVAQAWWSMIQCCRLGGWVLSVTPVIAVNQGFWSVSPAAYKDFCENNGMRLTYATAQSFYGDKMFALPLNMTMRDRTVPDETINLALMQKIQHRDTPVWPIMTKFRKNPKCQFVRPNDQARSDSAATV